MLASSQTFQSSQEQSSSGLIGVLGSWFLGASLGASLAVLLHSNIASAGSAYHHYSEGNPHGVPVTVDGCVKIISDYNSRYLGRQNKLRKYFSPPEFHTGIDFSGYYVVSPIKGRVSSITKPGVNSELYYKAG